MPKECYPSLPRFAEGARRDRDCRTKRSSLKDLRTFPDPVRDEVGFALYLAQMGSRGENTKVLKGFSGAGVIEVLEDYDGDTYRSVYTVKFKNAVYVLHCFQKKSKSGSELPKQDKDLINSRLQAAQKHAKEDES
ncbi:MAG: type II toxin-antitoxin system RelE/ParE family toxin [Anaerolineae bacterium]|nr:type II toxin-antitoxin system RelE/ParE family toxin [Gloeobacterales cyanobacterium ES-bin-313]